MQWTNVWLLLVTALVEALGAAGEADKAVEMVEFMEQRGVLKSAGVYYALACALCTGGRWSEALLQVQITCDVLEISFNSMGLFIESRFSMIYHWLFCIQISNSFLFVVHIWRYCLNLNEDQPISAQWKPISL